MSGRSPKQLGLAIVVLAVLVAVVVYYFVSTASAGGSTAPAGSSAQAGSTAPAPGASESGRVTHLVDGDTLDVSLRGTVTRIRLLNIDTPETKKESTPVQCMGPEAAARLAQLAPVGSSVTLSFDVERLDQYGRTLATVTPGGENASEVLAAAGLGRAVKYGQNVAGYATVAAAEKQARAKKLGIYSGRCR